MKKLLLIFLSLMTCFLNFLASEEDYLYSLSGQFSNLEDESDADGQGYLLSGTVYFLPLNAKGHLRHEVAFLERTGSASLTVFKAENESSTNLKSDNKLYSINTKIMEKNKDYYLELNYLKSDLKYDSPIDFEGDTDQFKVVGGWFLDKTWRVSGSYTHSRAIYDGSNVSNTEVVSKTNVYGLETKYVKDLKKQGYSLHYSVELVEENSSIVNETNVVSTIEGEYFFNRDISLGLSLEYDVGEDKSDEGVSLQPYFVVYFTSNFHMDFVYIKFYADDQVGKDFNYYNISCNYNF